jgi:hypothetical protein
MTCGERNAPLSAAGEERVVKRSADRVSKSPPHPNPLQRRGGKKKGITVLSKALSIGEGWVRLKPDKKLTIKTKTTK